MTFGSAGLWNVVNNHIVRVEDVPNVDCRGQGGLGDVILHPDYEDNGLIYLCYAESGVGYTRGAALARGRLVGRLLKLMPAVD